MMTCSLLVYNIFLACTSHRRAWGNSLLTSGCGYAQMVLSILDPQLEAAPKCSQFLETPQVTLNQHPQQHQHILMIANAVWTKLCVSSSDPSFTPKTKNPMQACLCFQFQHQQFIAFNSPLQINALNSYQVMLLTWQELNPQPLAKVGMSFIRFLMSFITSIMSGDIECIRVIL